MTSSGAGPRRVDAAGPRPVQFGLSTSRRRRGSDLDRQLCLGLGAAQLERPRGLTSDGTSVYWGEQTSYTIRQAELASTSVSTLAGERNCVGPQDGIGGTATAGACGASTLARFTTPFGLAFDYPSQSLYVIESGRISRIQ